MSEFADPTTYTERDAKLNAALAKAQGAFPNVKKGHEADAGAFKYSYASLDAVLDVIRKPLAENGLALVQLPEGGGLRTELRHAEGGSIVSLWPWPTVPENIQAYGKLVSYMRRYAILCVLGLATEDNDGAGIPVGAKMATQAKMLKIGKLVKGLEASQPTGEGESWADAMRNYVGGQHGEQMTAEQADNAIEFLEKADIPFG